MKQNAALTALIEKPRYHWMDAYYAHEVPSGFKIGAKRNEVICAMEKASRHIAMAKFTGNALNLWAAHQVLRSADLPPPPIVRRYLDAVAQALLVKGPGLTREPAQIIAAALMMSGRGRGTVFTTFADCVGAIIEQEMDRAIAKGDAEHIAIGNAARTARKSKRVVKRYWRVIKQAREEMMFLNVEGSPFWRGRRSAA